MDLYRDVIDVGLRLSVATLCGSIVGANRERKHRPAGLRTMMLVALGAAAFALLGDRAVSSLEDKTAAGRVLAGIVGGIGFLGAGTILQTKGTIRGVTTAASIWMVAAVGSACGLGYYPIAGFAVGLTMIVLWLAPVEKEVFGPKHPHHGQQLKGEKDQVLRQSRREPP